MYPRNNASPPTIAIGSIYLIADGTIQTSGASVRVKTGSGAWGAGGGSLAYDATSGAITYTPTQAETNDEEFHVAVYKASCTTACVTVVTTAESTAGTAKVGSHTGTINTLDALDTAQDTKHDATVTALSDGTVSANLEDDAITAAKYDESTAYPLKSADTGSTEVARTGADSDTLETLSDQIDTLSAAGDGARTITITVEDADSGAKIQDAHVRLTAAGLGTVVDTTNASGVATLYVDDATWTAVVTANGYTGTSESLVVDGDETDTRELTAQSITPPAAASLCTIGTYVFDGAGQPDSGATFAAVLEAENAAVDTALLTLQTTTDTTDSNGYGELQLLRADQFTNGTGRYHITVADSDGNRCMSVRMAIPNQATAMLEDLLA